MDGLLSNAILNMNAKQVEWTQRMRRNLEILEDQWQKWLQFERCDQELFNETDTKVREAASRLGIEVQDVAEAEGENDGWDGERYGRFVVLSDAVYAICLHYANKLLKNRQGFIHTGDQFGSFAVVRKPGEFRYAVEDTRTGVVFMVGGSIAAAVAMAKEKHTESR